jgi:hypothetical protein
LASIQSKAVRKSFCRALDLSQRLVYPPRFRLRTLTIRNHESHSNRHYSPSAAYYGVVSRFNRQQHETQQLTSSSYRTTTSLNIFLLGNHEVKPPAASQAEQSTQVGRTLDRRYPNNSRRPQAHSSHCLCHCHRACLASEWEKPLQRERLKKFPTLPVPHSTLSHVSLAQ